MILRTFELKVSVIFAKIPPGTISHPAYPFFAFWYRLLQFLFKLLYIWHVIFKTLAYGLLWKTYRIGHAARFIIKEPPAVRGTSFNLDLFRLPAFASTPTVVRYVLPCLTIKPH